MLLVSCEECARPFPHDKRAKAQIVWPLLSSIGFAPQHRRLPNRRTA